MTTTAFPDHNIDPKKKGKDFILQFAKAALSGWKNVPTGGIFRAKAADYAEIRSYAMGIQSTLKYQKELLPEDENNESYTKISWKPRPDGVVLRNIAVAKLQKAGYNILATPINAQAKDAQDEMYAKAKVKIMMREAMEQQDPELAKHPSLKRMPGEAEDLEELQIEIDHNPKFVRAKDIEESVQLVFYENEADKLWDVISEDMVDLGAGLAKEGLDENNKVILRYVNPSQFVCSYARTKEELKNITFAGEVISMKVSDLSQYFNPDEIEKIVNMARVNNGNPTVLGDNTIGNNGYDIFKVDVFDFEFVSWDKRVTESNKDKFGNTKTSKANPSAADTHYVDEKGILVEKKPTDSEFISKTVENVYKGKWVVGTDFIFAYGKAENMKRTVNVATMSKTRLSYHVAVASFSNMQATGLTEAMIPIIDDLNIATFKLRNFRNRMVPNGFDIDLAAIEEVAIGAGGKKMTPKEVINMFFETGVLISRRSGISMDSNVNYKAINAISNNMADQIVSLANDIQMSKQALRDITGLNELTDGSTPNPKTLTTIANLANESTNNALYYLINARRNLIESVAKATIQRLQVAMKKGPYDGFDRTAGRWITVPKSIEDYDYDIMIEDKPGEEQKQIIYSLMQEDIVNGYVSHADVIAIIYANNLKSAAMLLSYKVKKAKEQQQAMALQNTQATAQAQMQSNQMAEGVKLQADMARHKMLLEEIELTKSWDYMIAKEKLAQADVAVDKKAITQIITSGMPMPQEAPAQENAEPQQEPMQQEAMEQPVQ